MQHTGADVVWHWPCLRWQEESRLNYQGDHLVDEPKKSGLLRRIKPAYAIGFLVWAAVLAAGIAAVLYQPAPEPRGLLSLGSADAPVTVLEFADFQ